MKISLRDVAFCVIVGTVTDQTISTKYGLNVLCRLPLFASPIENSFDSRRLRGGSDDVEMKLENYTFDDKDDGDSLSDVNLDENSTSLPDEVLEPMDPELEKNEMNDSWRPNRVWLRHEYSSQMALPKDAPLFPPATSAETTAGLAAANAANQRFFSMMQKGDNESTSEETLERGWWGGENPEAPDFDDAGPPGEAAGYEDLVVPDMVEGIPAAVRAVAHHHTSPVTGALRRLVVRAGEHRWDGPLRLHPKWVFDAHPRSPPYPFPPALFEIPNARGPSTQKPPPERIPPLPNLRTTIRGPATLTPSRTIRPAASPPAPPHAA